MKEAGRSTGRLFWATLGAGVPGQDGQQPAFSATDLRQRNRLRPVLVQNYKISDEPGKP